MSDTNQKPKQPEGDFAPNPTHAYARLDTAYGENGAQLHKVAPHVYPENPSDVIVSPEDAEESVASVTPEDGESVGNPGYDETPVDPTQGAHGSQGVEGTVTNSKSESSQILVGGQPVEPVTGSGPSGAPLTEQPEPGSGKLSDADEARAQGLIDDAGNPTTEDGGVAAVSDAEDYTGEKWNVDTLKEELHKRKLTVGGNKAELQKRLIEDDRAKASGDKS
jgi:hypothetical protein